MISFYYYDLIIVWGGGEIISLKNTVIFPVRFSISNNIKLKNVFRIDNNNGTVFLVKPLDRESAAWQNLTIIAKETSECVIYVAICSFLLTICCAHVVWL